MKKILTVLTAFLFSAALFAQSLSGYDIVKKAYDEPEPQNSSMTATLTIHSKKGGDRVREVIMLSKDYGEVSKEVIVFTAPKDVSGTGYLMFEYPEDSSGNKKDSDNWLYMPAMGKTRRIASSGSEGEGSFMGTDFTYQDMGERGLSRDDYTLLGEETVDGVLCWKVDCVSKAHTEKDPRRIVYIGKEDFVMRKCEFYDRQNNLHRVLTVGEVTTVSGYTSAKYMKMENIQTGSWSEIQMKDVVYDSKDVDDSLFTVAALEKGRIR